MQIYFVSHILHSLVGKKNIKLRLCFGLPV